MTSSVGTPGRAEVSEQELAEQLPALQAQDAALARELAQETAAAAALLAEAPPGAGIPGGGTQS